VRLRKYSQLGAVESAAPETNQPAIDALPCGTGVAEPETRYRHRFTDFVSVPADPSDKSLGYSTVR
jgi:hypothetical protein